MRVVLIILMGCKATVSVIRNCCPVKRSPANGLKHQTQALNAISNGGDASRVREKNQLLFNAPTRDASPPLVLAFGACARLHVYVLMDNDKLETLLKLNAIKAFNSRWTLCVRLVVKGLNCVSLFV